MNAVVVAVLVMLILATLRVYVVLSLFLGALVDGLLSGIGLEATMAAFQEGLAGGARIALSYALLGTFATAIAHFGLTQLLADSSIHRLDGQTSGQKTAFWVKWGMLAGIAAMAVMSQNLVPVHIAFILLLIPPLLAIMTQLRSDRHAVACITTFGLVTTYMYLPLGFGKIFPRDILLGNIARAGLDVEGVNVVVAMGIPASGMIVGLLIAVLVVYRKPRDYDPDAKVDVAAPVKMSKPKVAVAVVAIGASFIIQSWLTITDPKADPFLVSTLAGLFVFIATGVIRRLGADEVFTSGMRMMALIGFIMIIAQGFVSVTKASGQVEPLAQATAGLFGDNEVMAAFTTLLAGLLVTMGIRSSFSTLPIITAIYVLLCAALGFSPLATVSIIGTAGALGGAGSPASGSTLGPTAGLNADGQHDRVRDTVIPTFLHFSLPLLAVDWVAAMTL